MTSITFVTPVAAYHHDQVARISRVVAEQTISCHHIIIHDTERRGAGWARNQGLNQVQTPLVVFLDADDDLEPTFAEHTLAAYEANNRTRYIYTDWWEDDQLIQAPVCAWIKGKVHLITTLLPTTWARIVGGFDEGLPGAEDSAFYMAMVMRSMCGTRLPEPLVHYGIGGQRSSSFVKSIEANRVQSWLKGLYRGQIVACCGTDTPQENPIVGEPQANDVLAQALWSHNHTPFGRATGRQYPYGAYPDKMWVDQRDIDIAPSMFQRIEETVPVYEPAEYDDVRELAARMMQTEVTSNGHAYALPVETVPANVEVKADVSKVLAKAKRR